MHIELYKERSSPIQKKDLIKTIKIAFKVLRLQPDFSLSVAIVSEKTSQNLNRTWRGKNRPASVLSFKGETLISKKKKKEKNKFFILPLEEKKFLGEIIIADPVVKKLALKRKSSYFQEFNFLFIHGLLHLRGYGHAHNSSRKKMERLEKKICQLLIGGH